MIIVSAFDKQDFGILKNSQTLISSLSTDEMYIWCGILINHVRYYLSMFFKDILSQKLVLKMGSYHISLTQIMGKIMGGGLVVIVKYMQLKCLSLLFTDIFL